MIKTWQHKGLKSFYETGSKKGIMPAHAIKLLEVLQLLEVATCKEDINISYLRLHELTGKLKGFLSVRVNGNWRVIFKFEGTDVVLVNYLDYH
jgi:proteic killer suppression protein